MKKKNLPGWLATIFLIFLLPVLGKAQSCDPLDAKQLKDLLVQLGYSPKEISAAGGKEKYEIAISTTSFNVPVAIEKSASGNFIWLTVNLGAPKSDTSVVNAALLKENFKIQPSQFYITSKGILMMGVAVENRGVTPAILRRHIDKLAGDVSNTANLWN